MHSYVAIKSKSFKSGGLYECIEWARQCIAARKAQVVKIAKARPKEGKAIIIMEVSKDGIRKVSGGRVISLVVLKKARKNGQEETV